MVQIITDTSTLFTIEEGKQKNIHVIPLCVTLGSEQYRDLCFDTNVIYQKIQEGITPSTSQPPLGDILDAYEAYPEDEIINICMADGLSGTYQTALMAREQSANPERIHVINSKTLCGPHQYIVEKAIRLRDEGYNASEIVEKLQESIENEHSFLIPQDFSFLKRGGRLKPTAAHIGGLLKLKPIMESVDNGSRLDKFNVSRTLSKAIEHIIHAFQNDGVDENSIIYVSHADALEDSKFFIERLKKAFPQTEITLLELSPVFISQGGPHCIAVQYIRK